MCPIYQSDINISSENKLYWMIHTETTIIFYSSLVRPQKSLFTIFDQQCQLPFRLLERIQRKSQKGEDFFL